MPHLSCNIDRRGRRARAISGVLTIAAGIVVLVWLGPTWVGWTIAAAAAVFGGFQLYEARRGWCIVRALGIKTPM